MDNTVQQVFVTDKNMYGTAQFKLYTRVQVHVCACTFNACKTSKTGVCMHCCKRFWHTHMGQQTHTTHERCTSRARTWFATLKMYLAYVLTSLFAKIFLSNRFYLYGSPKFSLAKYFPCTVCCNEHCLIILLKRRGYTEHSRIFSCCQWIRSSIVHAARICIIEK